MQVINSEQKITLPTITISENVLGKNVNNENNINLANIKQKERSEYSIDSWDSNLEKQESYYDYIPMYVTILEWVLNKPSKTSLSEYIKITE